MSSPSDRLRPPPSERFAGPEHRIELAAALDALRAEHHESSDRHRQITVFHKGPLRIVLFTFEAGAGLPSHRAPGFVVIHTLRGRIGVKTMNASHDLAAGQLVLLDPEVVHDVTAAEPSDMLLTISLGGR
ncbi:MAG TPA: AraC family ligand binding domain-containing protein [Gemmatimonadaceae bacterium]|nr:AraC family ligand binding domain-containing protein [Gemmatimonadaceae bacterium]